MRVALSRPARGLRGALAAALLTGCSGAGVLLSEPPVPAPPGPAPAVCGDGVVDVTELCDDGVNDDLDGGCRPGCEEEDLYQEVFSGSVLEVDITMEPALWDAMRTQRKTRHSVFGTEDCRNAPVANPYTWFPAVVTIDGETMAGAGVRKKGHFGSQSTTVPSMKLKFDEFEDGGRFHTMKRLALNNSKSDRSYLRTCAAYSLFAAAGLPAPLCTYAHVTVNGEAYGMYVATEEIKKPFLRRRFADPSGTLYEGTACDFRPEFIGGFEQETNEEEDSSHADLLAVYEAIQGASDDELLERLEPLIDLDEFFRFWAVEGLIWHRDGYSGNANNYFMYADPELNGRFRFLPWGPDSTFRANGQAALPDSVLAYGVITNRLYAIPASRDRYYEALADLLATTWDVDAMVAEGGRVQEILRPYLTEPEQDALAAQILGVTTVILEREAVIAAAIAGGYPEWTAGLRFNPCRIPVVPIEGTFDTTWGTLSDNFYTAGTSTVTLNGEVVTSTQAGARAGAIGDGRTRVQMRIETPDALRYTLTFTLAQPPWFETYSVVGDHDLGTPPVNTSVNVHDISGDTVVQIDRFDATEGRWTFEVIETTEGGAVIGSFEGTLWDLP